MNDHLDSGAGHTGPVVTTLRMPVDLITDGQLTFGVRMQSLYDSTYLHFFIDEDVANYWNHYTTYWVRRTVRVGTAVVLLGVSHVTCLPAGVLPIACPSHFSLPPLSLPQVTARHTVRAGNHVLRWEFHKELYEEGEQPEYALVRPGTLCHRDALFLITLVLCRLPAYLVLCCCSLLHCAAYRCCLRVGSPISTRSRPASCTQLNAITLTGTRTGGASSCDVCRAGSAAAEGDPACTTCEPGHWRSGSITLKYMISWFCLPDMIPR